MVSAQRHEMHLTMTHPSGAEEWYCPECGRRMTITWHPWKKVILEKGDLHVAHGGSKGGLKLGALHIGHQPGLSAPTNSAVDDPYLAPWTQWLDNMNWDDSDEES